jgi:GDP/UDP-N,N'-diacetylbacillosamine 2-epimerase (hydrolysing)
MSHLHFVAAEEYRQRVIQLGENPEKVFMVGGVGIDNIQRLQLLDRNALEEELSFKFSSKNLLVTFHPVTLEHATAPRQMEELLKALAELPDTQIIFTSPNADTDGRALTPMIQNFVAQHDNSVMFKSLGQLRYLSCLQYVDAVVGNSSSGLLEAPTFKKGTINIGGRQVGRLRAASIIDCEPTREAISAALDRLYSAEFQQSLVKVKNPYGEGGASRKIVQELARVSLEGLVKKTFFDLKVH